MRPTLGQMAQDMTRIQLDALLTDVGAVIGDLLQRLGHGPEPEGEADIELTGGDFLFRIKPDLTLELINRVIEGQHPFGKLRIVFGQGLIGISEHADDAVGHHPKRLGRFVGRLAIVMHDFRDRHRTIGDALQLIVDLHDHQHRTDRMLLGPPHRPHGDRRPPDFHIGLGDDRIAIDHQFRLILVDIEVGFDRPEDHIDDTITLGDQIVLELCQFVLKIAHRHSSAYESQIVTLYALLYATTRIHIGSDPSLRLRTNHGSDTLRDMIELGVNIDHVATIRQARRTYEPDPVWAATEAQLGGADGITLHLREDRRHIQDDDLRRLSELVQIKLNLEMAPTEEMVAIACKTKPQLAMLVPEGRQEVTTEGGLDASGPKHRLRSVGGRLRDAGITGSASSHASAHQIEAAQDCGFQVCEIHTGPYAHAFWNLGRAADSPEGVA